MSAPSPSPNAKAVRFIISLVLVLAVVALFQLNKPNGANNEAASPEADNAQTTAENGLEPAEKVTLGMQREDQEGNIKELASPISVPWHEGQTVIEATQLAGKQSVPWQNRWQNQGEMAFLLELGGRKNEGSEGLNWQFDLNGKYNQRGAGQTVLKPGDAILWQLAPYK